MRVNHYGAVLKWLRGLPAKELGQAIGARVRISSAPPLILNNLIFVVNNFTISKVVFLWY